MSRGNEEANVIADRALAGERQPRKLVGNVAIAAARLAGVVVFGLIAVQLGISGLDVLTNPWAPPEPPGTYAVPFFVGCIGVLVALTLLYKVARADSLLGTLGWLLGGVAVMVAILWLFLASDPLFAPGGPCTFDDPLHVSCWAAAPQPAT
jgi:hypothetical protein